MPPGPQFINRQRPPAPLGVRHGEGGRRGREEGEREGENTNRAGEGKKIDGKREHDRREALERCVRFMKNALQSSQSYVSHIFEEYLYLFCSLRI